MKKIISLLLILTLSLSLVACGQKEEIKDYVPPTPPQSSKPIDKTPTEPVKDNTDEQEEIAFNFSTELPELIKTDDAESKQSHWTKTIKNKKFVLDMNNASIHYQDLFTMETHLDDAEQKMLKIYGTIDGAEQGFELYILSDTEAYFHEYGAEDNNVHDKWFKVDVTNKEDLNLYDISLTNGETDYLIEWQNNIQEVVYLGTDNGFDYVEVKYVKERESDTDWIVTFDSTFEVEYNNEIGEFRYCVQTDESGSFSSIMTTWEKEIEGMDLMDWNFNTDTMMLTKEEETLSCKLISDNLSNENEPLSAVLVLNPNDDSLIAIYLDVDGVKTAVNLSRANDLSNMMVIPENIEESLTLEDVAMRLAMASLMFALSDL